MKLGCRSNKDEIIEENDREENIELFTVSIALR